MFGWPMRKILPVIAILLLSCARMGENVRPGQIEHNLPTQAKSQTREDAERMAREKAMSRCREQGYSDFVELELHTRGTGSSGRECKTVSVPCPKAQKNADPSKDGKPCLEYQCSDRSIDWESHLLFECK